VNQFGLEIIKGLNTHLDDQDELQDEAKQFFTEWFEKNLDPVAIANDPDAFFAEMSNKAEKVFQKKFLPEILDNAEKFGREIFKGARDAK